MLLIVDSGSTKTDWCFAWSSTKWTIVKTDGINPVVQSQEFITRILKCQLLPQINRLGIEIRSISAIHFYGSGCTKEKSHIVVYVLKEIFAPSTPQIEVESDMLGAARALCGDSEGIACILGTGANSCIFNGNAIIFNTPPLGYILGDEGSGAVLGKLFVNGILKGTLPNVICNRFQNDSNLDKAKIIDAVYKESMPNRFLASLSKYIIRYIDDKQVEDIVIQNFIDFINKNIIQYGNKHNVINCVGSIAYYYKDQLEKAAQRCSYKIGNVMKSPILALIKYHLQNKVGRLMP